MKAYKKFVSLITVCHWLLTPPSGASSTQGGRIGLGHRLTLIRFLLALISNHCIPHSQLVEFSLCNIMVMRDIMLASFPGLPHFYLLFAFTIIHGSGRLAVYYCECKQGRPGNKANTMPYGNLVSRRMLVYQARPSLTLQKSEGK